MLFIDFALVYVMYQCVFSNVVWFLQFSLRSRTPSLNGSLYSPYNSLSRKVSGTTQYILSPALQADVLFFCPCIPKVTFIFESKIFMKP